MNKLTQYSLRIPRCKTTPHVCTFRLCKNEKLINVSETIWQMAVCQVQYALTFLRENTQLIDLVAMVCEIPCHWLKNG
jgi:ribosomal protein L37AE/L43A